MKRVQQGFTLIELMIVVAIVGILAAIALPAYQDYVVRSKMSEPIAAIAACKTSVQEYASTKGAFQRMPTMRGVATLRLNTLRPARRPGRSRTGHHVRFGQHQGLAQRMHAEADACWQRDGDYRLDRIGDGM